MIRNIIIEGLKSNFQGLIDKHIANVNVFLNSPVGVAEHADVLETIEKELTIVAEYQDKLEVLNKYFKKD